VQGKSPARVKRALDKQNRALIHSEETVSSEGVSGGAEKGVEIEEGTDDDAERSRHMLMFPGGVGYKLLSMPDLSATPTSSFSKFHWFL